MRQHLQFPDGAIPPKTVNGIGPDESGNIELTLQEGTVTSVNGNLPNDSGAVTIPEASTSAAGLMAAADKTKLENTVSKAELEQVSFGDWISFNPSGIVFITHNFNNADAPGILQLRDNNGHPYELGCRTQFSANQITIDYSGLELSGTHTMRFFRSDASMIDLMMPDGAVALYENYTGGTWTDSTGGGHDLTATGTITASDGGAVFDSSSDKFTPASTWDLTAGANTVSLVLEAEKSNMVFMSVADDVQYGYYNNGFTTGSNSVTSDTVSLNTLDVSKPAHWVFVRNGSNTTYYLNGVLLPNKSTDSWSVNPVDGIGSVDTRYPFTGTIYHVAVYDAQLTADQVQQCWMYVKKTYNL